MAAFLSQRDVSDFWIDIDAATTAGAKICAHIVLQNKFTLRYPETNFHFRNMDIAADVRNGIEVDQCDAFIMSTRAMQVGTAVDAVRCELGFVQTGNPVEEQSVAWPASPEVADALSYWMEQAAVTGFTYASVQALHEGEPVCPRFPGVDAGSGLRPLNLNNFGAPILIMLIFMSAAIATRALRTSIEAAVKSRKSKNQVDPAIIQQVMVNSQTTTENKQRIQRNADLVRDNQTLITQLQEQMVGASAERSQLRQELSTLSATNKQLVAVLERSLHTQIASPKEDDVELTDTT